MCPVKFSCDCKIFEKGRYSISADSSGRDHGMQGQPMAYGTRPSRSPVGERKGCEKQVSISPSEQQSFESKPQGLKDGLKRSWPEIEAHSEIHGEM